ncbi:histone acetyltransferase type B catalytic subunit [Mucidula mucida]|nr:histone acetyltransferase type B catalytic subunit [Mucidula mucida]
MAEWAADSNEATKLSLVGCSGDAVHFHPTFTYPIFGEEEKIYGYKGLSIDMRFACGALTLFMSVTWSKQLASESTVDDVEGTLKEYLPQEYLVDAKTFEARAEEEARTFKPLGDLVHSYSRTSMGEQSHYEVYHATWATPGFRAYHQRMQLFILFFIEAGSFINDEDDQWEFFVLYEKRKGDGDAWTYHFMGYSSLYNFYYFPDRTRLRLSQFVVLPPFQRGGHGSALYSATYQYILAKPEIAELSVEDPAEAFEDLRDKNDLIMLFNHEKFITEGFGSSESSGGGRVGVGRGGSTTGKGKLGPPVDKHWAERWRLELKLATRQFQRLIEMVILSRLDSEPKAQKAYRLQVKERLYRFNFEMLAQLESEERLEKLEETFKSVTEDYRRILALVK